MDLGARSCGVCRRDSPPHALGEVWELKHPSLGYQIYQDVHMLGKWSFLLDSSSC